MAFLRVGRVILSAVPLLFLLFDTVGANAIAPKECAFNEQVERGEVFPSLLVVVRTIAKNGPSRLREIASTWARNIPHRTDQGILFVGSPEAEGNPLNGTLRDTYVNTDCDPALGREHDKWCKTVSMFKAAKVASERTKAEFGRRYWDWIYFVDDDVFLDPDNAQRWLAARFSTESPRGGNEKKKHVEGKRAGGKKGKEKHVDTHLASSALPLPADSRRRLAPSAQTDRAEVVALNACSAVRCSGYCGGVGWLVNAAAVDLFLNGGDKERYPLVEKEVYDKAQECGRWDDIAVGMIFADRQRRSGGSAKLEQVPMENVYGWGLTSTEVMDSMGKGREADGPPILYHYLTEEMKGGMESIDRLMKLSGSHREIEEPNRKKPCVYETSKDEPLPQVQKLLVAPDAGFPGPSVPAILARDSAVIPHENDSTGIGRGWVESDEREREGVSAKARVSDRVEGGSLQTFSASWRGAEGGEGLAASEPKTVASSNQAVRAPGLSSQGERGEALRKDKKESERKRTADDAAVPSDWFIRFL
uniref:Glycosyl transferase 64 domain-containing protein n=1 Tax=Chromera velia CCMP2878 TaxID=1169474 RepID=A0A0G4HEL0_9ALVE|eukprot:Cvel_26796.t1-p1 / transcript=Cvel_26796.t1 / gene=Cvel_26796 / organism=Chromera_velia_CCMP2878 / gene_product=hypothetical protein / transcript_product=hypothetical protein / location=Cvel_scaffold3244:8008-11584(-) / protein_length=532 / sequence_SO=supercontig / SO=protein_coding / is_pseudo=false